MDDFPAEARELIDDHLAWCVHRELAASTRRNRLAALERLAVFLHPRGHGLTDAKPRDLQGWQASMTCGPDGRRSLVLHARGFYRWAVDLELADHRLLRHLVVPRVPKRLPRPIPVTDLARAFELAPPRIRPWLLLGTFGGMRAGEIAVMRAEDLDFDARTLIVHGKGGKERVIVLAPPFIAVLRQLRLPDRGWLFPKLTKAAPHLPTSEHVTAGQVSKLASRFLHLQVKSRSSLHATRHRCLTDMYRESRDLQMVRDFAGHSTTQPTEGYAKISPDSMANAVDAVTARAMHALGLTLAPDAA